MNKSLLFTALLAATPVALLLPGCSGGALPGNPFPTAAPVATATPAATPRATATTTTTPRPTSQPGITRGQSTVQRIVISASADFNADQRPTFVTSQTLDFSNVTRFQAPSRPLGSDTGLTFEGPSLGRPAQVGDVFQLQNRSAAAGILYFRNGSERFWESTSGILTVTAATGNSVSFTLRGVTFAPQSFGTTTAKGTFTLNADGYFSGA